MAPAWTLLSCCMVVTQRHSYHHFLISTPQSIWDNEEFVSLHLTLYFYSLFCMVFSLFSHTSLCHEPLNRCCWCVREVMGGRPHCVSRAETLKVVSTEKKKNEEQVLLITFPHNHMQKLYEHIYHTTEILENLKLKILRQKILPCILN